MKCCAALCLILTLCIPGNLSAEDSLELSLFPNYMLPGSAARDLQPDRSSSADPESPWSLEAQPTPLLWNQTVPTDRKFFQLDWEPGENKPFTLELWVLDHVKYQRKQPLGAFLTIREPGGLQQPLATVGTWAGEAFFGIAQSPVGPFSRRNQVKSQPIELPHHGWARYYYHLVLTYDGSALKYYFNGELQPDVITERLSDWRGADWPAAPWFELSGYFALDPGLTLENFTQHAAAYPKALTAEEVEQAFLKRQGGILEGIRFPDQPHFTAGPYLNYATETGINLLFETDRPMEAVVEVLRQLPEDVANELSAAELISEKNMTRDRENDPSSSEFRRVLALAPEDRLHEMTLDGLNPDTPYFYRVVAREPEGESSDPTILDSGYLTFQTAVRPNQAFVFAIIGDTETRPHVNDKAAKQIWTERPHFALNLGDMTDSGREPRRFEWTHEYFLSMTQLHSRVPVFPVPGNGEKDLVWYRHYHRLPGDESHYSFKYGNAEFFMLDSNQDLGPDSIQYQWLEKALAASTATWKIACQHHAAYSSDENDYGNSWRGPSNHGDLNVQQLVPLFEKYGLDLNFFGHLHSYERSWPVKGKEAVGFTREGAANGTIYIQAGGAGGNLEDFAPTRVKRSAKTYTGHHYLMIRITGDHLRMEARDLEGRLRDYMDLVK